MLKHILLSTLLCFSLQIEHCLKHINVCKKCDSNSYLVQTPSLTYCSKIEHCIYISDDEQTCNECMDAYQLTTDGKCEQKYDLIENCLAYRTSNVNYQTTTCDECVKGYALSWDAKNCVKFENCEILAQDKSKCYECPSSYQLNSEGKCEVSTCESFSNNKCDECVDGYYVDSGGNCKQIPIKYCESGDANSCRHCKDFAELNNGQCVLRSNFIAECERYSEDETTCLRCHQGYSFNTDNTKCELNYCQESEQLCYECEDGYFSEGKTCKSYNGEKSYGEKPFLVFNYSLILFFIFLIL